MAITIAVDAMSGDVGLGVTVPASTQFIRDYPDARLILVGDRASLQARLHKHLDTGRIDICHASQVVSMDEAPQVALKNKKDSSMRVAINLVKGGRAQAVVSAGNTGALMATARFVLKTLPGIGRPAIAKVLPTIKGTSCVLDLGANIDCMPEQLLQFGIMGAELMACVGAKPNPSVGLLNIGSEAIKGNETIKKAAEYLRQSALNFYGNVEGDDICRGTVDVIVCDGFTGNVALKMAEGLACMMNAFLHQEFSRTIWTRLGTLAALPALNSFKKRVDPRRYNGASLLGLRGIVVKSHGGTDVIGFRYALSQAFEEVGSDVIGHIRDRVAHHVASYKFSKI